MIYQDDQTIGIVRTTLRNFDIQTGSANSMLCSMWINWLSRIILSHWHFLGALWVMSSSHPVWRRFESRRIGMVIPLSSSPLRSVPISRSCQSTLRAQWAHGNCRRTRQYLLTFLILSHHTWQKRILILYILFAMCELLLLLYTQPQTPINIPSLNSVECIGNLYRMVPIKSPADQDRGSSAGFPQRADPAAVFRQWGHLSQRQEVWLGMELCQSWANDVVQEEKYV